MAHIGHLKSDYEITKAIKLLIILLFFLTTMTAELSKYLNEQLRVFFNMKQQNKNKVAENMKLWIFKQKLFCIM